jgi:hypothetical protein
MNRKREMRSIAVRVDRAVVALSEAGRMLSALGLERYAREMHTSAFCAATALSGAENEGQQGPSK